MKKIKGNAILALVLLGMVITSCSQSKFIVAPPFTDVEKISKIEIGQSKEDVNKTLGISPYDVLYLNEGDYMCYYNYRLVDRKINVDNSNKNRNAGNGATLSSEKAQTVGEPFYSEWRRIYVNFVDGKVSHFVTDAGLEDANYIQLVNGTIKLFGKEDLVLSNFYNQDVININSGGGSSQDGKIQTNGTKSLNIDALLFQLKYNGKFKQTDTPRKKNKGLLK